MCVIQDCSVSTLVCKKVIKLERVEYDYRRICGSVLETLSRLIFSCTVINPMQYTARHKAICKLIRQNLEYKYELITEIYPAPISKVDQLNFEDLTSFN